MVERLANMSPLVFISVVAAVLKLLGLIDWEWWVVLLPLGLNVFVNLLLLAYLGILVLRASEMGDEDERR